MPSNYRSFRKSVPWLILFLETVFIILFYFLFSGYNASISNISYTGKTAGFAVKGRVECVLLFCSAVELGFNSFVFLLMSRMFLLPFKYSSLPCIIFIYIKAKTVNKDVILIALLICFCCLLVVILIPMNINFWGQALHWVTGLTLAQWRRRATK